MSERQLRPGQKRVPVDTEVSGSVTKTFRVDCEDDDLVDELARRVGVDPLKVTMISVSRVFKRRPDMFYYQWTVRANE